MKYYDYFKKLNVINSIKLQHVYFFITLVTDFKLQGHYQEQQKSGFPLYWATEPTAFNFYFFSFLVQPLSTHHCRYKGSFFLLLITPKDITQSVGLL